MGFPQGHVVHAQVIQHIRSLSRVMLQEIVGAGEVFERMGFFPQTVIHHRTVMGNGRRRLPVRVLLVRLRFIELFQRSLEGMHHATLDRAHCLLSNDARDHVPLCHLLVEFAGTIEIAYRGTVAWQAPLPERTPAPSEGQCRLVKGGWLTDQECLDRIEGLREVPLALQGSYSIQ